MTFGKKSSQKIFTKNLYPIDAYIDLQVIFHIDSVLSVSLCTMTRLRWLRERLVEFRSFVQVDRVVVGGFKCGKSATALNECLAMHYCINVPVGACFMYGGSEIVIYAGLTGLVFAIFVLAGAICSDGEYLILNGAG